MPDREDRVRQLAYFLWLEEGCPQGEAERHWQAAEVLFESEPVERKEREGEPPGEPAGKAQTAPASDQPPAAATSLRRRAAPPEKGE
jgi:Protein of unknown function (DUF2934)